MATGDIQDFVNRLTLRLPSGWFGDVGPTTTPLLTGVLNGLAGAWAVVWNQLAYVRAQTRISTATEGNLDLISADLYGGVLPRRTGLLQAVQAYTGYPPKLVELQNATDTGGWGSRATSTTVGTGLGYGVAGAFGSRLMPFQCMLTVTRPPITAPPNIGGWGSRANPAVGGGYGWGSRATPGAGGGRLEYATAELIAGGSDADIYAVISAAAPAAVVVWTQIVPQPAAAGDRLDINFIADESVIQ
jgi:hypothetical protein